MKFLYKATNAQGKVVNGTLDLANRNAVLEKLKKDNLKPISIKQETTAKSGLSLSFLKSKVKSKDLVIFTRQLSTMVSAGVPILRALTTLQAQTESKRLKEVLEVVNKDVQGGKSLGDSFANFPEVFDEVFVNMVRAGEAGGILDEILKRLAVQQEKDDSIRRKVKGAMTYPIVLICITVLAFFGLMLFVIPQIGNILKDLGGENAELPFVTQVMLNISDFMLNRWYVVIGVMVLVAYLFTRWVKTPSGRLTFDRTITKAPIIGQIVKKLAVARFARIFASLMGAGVSVIESLKVTAKALGNKAYEGEVLAAAEQVKNGKQLSEAMSGSKLFPEIVAQMLAVGEETGQIDTVLLKVADFYEEEVDTLIGSLSSILEPVMIVIMGSLVGLIAISVLQPITSLSQNIE